MQRGSLDHTAVRTVLRALDHERAPGGAVAFHGQPGGGGQGPEGGAGLDEAERARRSGLAGRGPQRGRGAGARELRDRRHGGEGGN